MEEVGMLLEHIGGMVQELVVIEFCLVMVMVLVAASVFTRWRDKK